MPFFKRRVFFSVVLKNFPWFFFIRSYLQNWIDSPLFSYLRTFTSYSYEFHTLFDNVTEKSNNEFCFTKKGTEEILILF
jgi:hypothetical protein